MGFLSIISTALSLINRLTRWAERRSFIARGRSEMMQKYTVQYLESKNASREQIARAANMSMDEVNAGLDDSDFVN